MFLLAYLPVVAFFALEGVRRAPAGAGERDASTNLVGVTLVVMSAAPLVVRLAIPFARTGFAVLMTGIVLGFAGVAVRWSAMETLGRFYSRKIEFQDSHRIVQEGIYGRVRHPGYLGTLLTFLGFGLAMASFLGATLNAVLFFVAYLNRMRVEERAMVETFGAEYEGYRCHTWRIIPFVY